MSGKLYAKDFYYVYRLFDTVEEKFCSSGRSLYGNGRNIWANKAGATNALRNMPKNLQERIVAKKFKLVEVRETEVPQVVLAGTLDNTGQTCAICKSGVYKETSIIDDWTGVLHCSECGCEVERWIAEK